MDTGADAHFWRLRLRQDAPGFSSYALHIERLRAIWGHALTSLQEKICGTQTPGYRRRRGAVQHTKMDCEVILQSGAHSVRKNRSTRLLLTG